MVILKLMRIMTLITIIKIMNFIITTKQNILGDYRLLYKYIGEFYLQKKIVLYFNIIILFIFMQ